ncbi:MAG: type II toxin-antitoxin system PemK/MazF family toxin [Ferrovibrio sp.]
MANFKAGDIVKVPFPYTDRATRQHRPALVVSAPGLEESHGLLWVSMITSAENRAWPSDSSLIWPGLACRFRR